MEQQATRGRMRSRALLAGVVLGSALVSGGWLVERGLSSSRSTTSDGPRLFNEVYQHVAHDFVDTLTDSTLYARAADGLLEELHDPHSSYLPPDLLARLSERTSGRYAGVGAQIDVRDGWITIVAPLPGGPALDAGIQAGDRIVQVNDKPMHEMTVEEAQKALRGAPGSVVKLTIERPGVTAPLKFALTRREIRVRSVQHATMLSNGVGYVALSIFSEESAPDLRRAIDSLRAAGMTSLVFDLRGDPGGLLDQGVGIADLFLDPGQGIVSMRGRTAESNRSYVDRDPQRWPNMPVTVLVDSMSASAAEIVAGALQDHDRALLVGRTTYGKGSAQNVFPLGAEGAVKLTTALWYTPSGRSIDKRRAAEADSVSGDSTRARPKYHTDSGRTVLGGGGIIPDVILPQVAVVTTDSVFFGALDNQIPKFLDALTEYALSLKAAGTIKQPDFVVTPEMRAELFRRMRARGITVDEKTFEAARTLIDRQFGYLVARYVFGEPAEFARRLHDDPGVAAALKLTTGATTPQQLLQRASSR